MMREIRGVSNMNRFTSILLLLLVGQVAAYQSEEGRWDDLDVVLELINLGIPADCFNPRFLQGLPLEPGHPAINQNLGETKRGFCSELAIRKADRIAVGKRDMLQFMVGPIPRN